MVKKASRNLNHGKSKVKSIGEGKIRKHINNVLKKTTHKWLGEVSSNVMKNAVQTATKARDDFLDGKKGEPKFKTRHKSKVSFYVNYESLKRLPNGFQGEKLGYVKTKESLPKIKGKYKNPHISFDGTYWYLSVCYEVKPLKVKLNDESIGIDLGVKELAVLSTGKIYPNINKTRRVKQLKKRLKREQRKVSRKIEGNILKRDSRQRPIYKRPLKECRNIQRQNSKIRLIHKKLTDIRNNYLHQITTEIVKTKPSRIVMENLNIRGMMKNRHLSKAIAEQKFYEFKRQMKYKCEFYGIEFVEVGRFYASSKACSRCGHVKADLKLSDRIYRCSECGLKIDRDLNAAINLANYKI
jgi:putative transposase